jgi:hypothetical protein
LSPTKELLTLSRDKRGYRSIVNENLNQEVHNDGLRRLKKADIIHRDLINGLDVLMNFSFFELLIVSAAVIIFSLQECKLQAPPTDYPKRSGSWSMLMCLKEGSKLVIYGTSDYLYDRPIVITLKIGGTVFI